MVMVAMHPDMEAFLADEQRVGKILSMAAHRTGHAPGMDKDDFMQEGRIHLWRYAGNYHPEQGKAVDGFAYRLAHRGMLNAKRAACGRQGQKVAPWRSQFPATTNSHGDSVEEDFGTADGGYSIVDARLDLDVFRRRVSRRDWFVAEQVFGLGRTMAAVGGDVGLSESRVCQILARVKREVWTRKEAVVLDNVVCSKCKQEKPADAFPPSVIKKIKAGKWGQCRKCAYKPVREKVPEATVAEPPTSGTTWDSVGEPPIEKSIRVLLDRVDQRLAAIDAERTHLLKIRENIAPLVSAK